MKLRLNVRKALFTEGPEVVGNPDCPIMYRWTLIEGSIKVLVHHFLPNGDDPDPHDHPRSFVTLVLAGEYMNEEELGPRDNSGHRPVRLQHMHRGSLKLRRARHLHRTLIGPRGCWSIVVMGPIERPWGFTWEGKWWPWKKYLDERGDVAIRCPQ